MRRTHLTSAAFLTTATLTAVVISACGGSDPPAQQPAASAYPQQGYPPPGYPQQQPGYPQQPAQPGYPQPAPTAAPTAPPAAGGTMSVPGPLALACQNDGACGTHKCNTQYGKCAFPCASPVDCATGNSCMMGVCVPGVH